MPRERLNRTCGSATRCQVRAERMAQNVDARDRKWSQCRAGIPRTRGRSDRSDAVPGTELQRVRGAVRSVDQGGVPCARDPIGGATSSTHDRRVRHPLPCRAESSRHRQRVDSAARASGWPRTCSPPPTDWWRAELLLPCRVAFKGSDRVIGHYGLDNPLLQQAPLPRRAATHVQRRERLGGVLNFYHREAA